MNKKELIKINTTENDITLSGRELHEFLGIGTQYTKWFDRMKEYGFEEIEKEVKKMCNLGEMIARENIEKGHSIGLEQGLVQGQKLERITSIKNLMKKMAIPLDKAMDLLDLSSIEKEEMKKYFQA